MVSRQFFQISTVVVVIKRHRRKIFTELSTVVDKYLLTVEGGHFTRVVFTFQEVFFTSRN